MPVSSLSSDDSENEEYPVISSKEESTLEEGSTQDEKTSEETSYEIKRSRLLKHNSWKGNKTLTQCSSSLSPNLKATMKATSIKPKKSRSDKRRSAMIRASAYDLCQSLISNHFKVVDDIAALSKRNENLSARLQEMVVALKKQGRAHPFSVRQECEAETISLLKRIMRQAVSQSSKNKKGQRYNDTVLLDFSLSLWIVGGPQTYEILYDNMPGVFPSPTVIRGKLEKYNPSCVPGKRVQAVITFNLPFQINSLRMYFSGSIYLDTLLDIIKENNYPKKVLISEDATAIIPKREFHLRYNSILGGSLPLGESGLPDPDGGVVNSAMDIIQNLKLYPAATVKFVIMAQPLADSAPPIRIGTFASDNKMTSLDVKRRHAFINERLKQAGLERVMTGSDGDSREMKFMLQHLGLGMHVSYLKYSKNSDEYRFFQLCPGFVCNIICSDFVIQDVPHIATKLRTKLLKPELIPLGNYVATANDLQYLLEQRSKQKTLIRQGLLIIHFCANLARKFYIDCINFLFR